MSDALMVFAKAPVPGRTKTRLIPALGAERAAALHGAFVRDVVARHQRPGRALTVWRAGDAEHPFWATLDADFAEQSVGDLGARMAAAFAATLAQATRVVVLGTDSPTLPPALVDQAFAALDQHDVALGPACDGGYWGMGLRAPRPGLFSDIPWGTEAVLAETLSRLDPAGARVLPFWYDVDRPADLALLRAELPWVEPAPRHTITALR